MSFLVQEMKTSSIIFKSVYHQVALLSLQHHGDLQAQIDKLKRYLLRAAKWLLICGARSH